MASLSKLLDHSDYTYLMNTYAWDYPSNNIENWEEEVFDDPNYHFIVPLHTLKYSAYY